MKIIERAHIDIEKWDELVRQTNDSTVFSYSWYLDATAENWCVLVDKDYTFGVALPYTMRAGQKILYTPIFVRYLEWLGQGHYSAQVQKIILENFKIVQINFRQSILGKDFDEFVYQVIASDNDRFISNQAKRSLSKAFKSGFTVEQGSVLVPIMARIKEELSGKFSGIDQHSLDSLSSTFERALEQGSIRTFEVRKDANCVGGVICIEDRNRLMYVKGAVTSDAKRNGAMYLALDTAIEYARQNNLLFDFGGSRIKGVRDFNHNLGGKDSVYFAYAFNNGPRWFKLAKTIKNRWIKR